VPEGWSHIWALQDNEADRAKIAEATQKKVSIDPLRAERRLTVAECDAALRLAELRNLSAVSAASLVLDSQEQRPVVDSVLLLNSVTFYHEARANLLNALSGLISRRTGRAMPVRLGRLPSCSIHIPGPAASTTALTPSHHGVFGRHSPHTPAYPGRGRVEGKHAGV